MAVLERAVVAETVAHPPDARRSRGHRPDIEGLRALAVMLVVLYHAGVPGLPGGYVGVDVFFVISGFLITTHLTTELRLRQTISLPAFYARRARRLLPMAALVSLVTLAGTWLLTSALPTRQLGADTVWAGLFGMNLRLAGEGVDYQAADDSASALQHFWSLAVEEQFYLLWPVLLLLVWVVGRRRTGVLAAVIGVVTVVSFAYGVHLTGEAKALAYFLSPSRAWELSLGGLVAVAGDRLTPGGRRAAAPAALGLGAIAVAAVTLDDRSAFPGWWALLPVLGTAAVIAAGLRGPTVVERWLLDRPLVQGLGRISYGVYLWHWPLLVLAPAYLGVDALDVRQGLAVVLVALWLSIGSWFVIEDPVRTAPALAGRPTRALVLALVLVAATTGAGAAAARLIPDPLGDGAAAAALADGTDVTRAVAEGARTRAVPSNLRPAVSRAELDEPGTTIRGAAACHANIQVTRLSTDPRDWCVFGDPHGGRTVVLTGDSHAFQWLPALLELARRHDWRLVSLTKAACPLYDVPLVNQTLNRDYTECYRWRQRVLDRIAREQPDLVVTSGAIFNPRPGLSPRWSTGVARTVGRLRATGARVVVVADTPYPGHDVPNCLAEHLDDARACRVPVDEALSDPQRRAATVEAARRAGATVINPVRWLCAPTGCPAVVGNTLVYRDNSHLTATYARFLASTLDQQLPEPQPKGPQPTSAATRAAPRRGASRRPRSP